MATISYIFYDEVSPAVLSTLPRLRAAEVAETKTKKGKLQYVVATKVWLEEQDAYNLHRPLRFARNPYTVNNVMDVWECDLFDVQSYAKYNINFKYILFYTDVFSKFLYLIPVKTKSGRAVTATLLSIFDDKTKLLSRRPVWVLTDKVINVSINIFRICYAKRSYSFRCAGTPREMCGRRKCASHYS